MDAQSNIGLVLGIVIPIISVMGWFLVRIDKRFEKLESKIDGVRADMHTMDKKVDCFREELKDEIRKVKEELKSDISRVKDELKSDIHNVKDELKSDIYKIDSNISLLKGENQYSKSVILTLISRDQEQKL